MYLNELSIEDFRSFDKATIPFSRDLTILVGENNAGKSNAIDALRLLTSPLSGRRENYCESTDIRFGASNRKFIIEAKFTGLDDHQKGIFLTAGGNVAVDWISLGLSYDESTGKFPFRPTYWGGPKRSSLEAGCADKICHVYLPPLRDAKRALASGNPTRIFALLKHFLNGGNPDELAKALRRESKNEILTKVDVSVDTGLQALTAGVRRQTASLGFASDEKLIDIARDLRFKLADHGIEPEDLRYSGHGYANLLYMATIAVELERANDADLTLFLVEEPEAHLHPQLQAAVLCFLEEQAEKSNKEKEDGVPKGQIQVVVATHSPNLSAWVKNEKLIFFRSYHVPVKQAEEPDRTAEFTPPAVLTETDPLQLEANVEAVLAVPSRRATRCIPLSQIPMPSPERRKIDRYLDVTKSAFLFGGRMLLVEGIAEALLLPVIAKHFVFKDNVEKFRLFRSAVFVPIDGVDFIPYARLLLSFLNDVRIADSVTIITDGDRTETNAAETSPGEARKIALEALAKFLKSEDCLHVYTNTYSLETELVRAGNASILKEIYLELHPKSEHNWTAAMGESGDKQADAIQGLFDNTRKGDFAQILAEKVSKHKTFVVPKYLIDAVNSVVA